MSYLVFLFEKFLFTTLENSSMLLYENCCEMSFQFYWFCFHILFIILCIIHIYYMFLLLSLTVQGSITCLYNTWKRSDTHAVKKREKMYTLFPWHFSAPQKNLLLLLNKRTNKQRSHCTWSQRSSMRTPFLPTCNYVIPFQQ